MRIKTIIIWVFIGFMAVAGCGPRKRATSNEPLIKQDLPRKTVSKQASPDTSSKTEPVLGKPVLDDEEGYRIRPMELETETARPYLPVGAEVSTRDDKVELWEVIKSMADLKGFSVSWAGDVEQKDLVNVDIKPKDNFWDALDNILRQLDYYYEVENNTIIIKYKVTKKYHLSMPFLKEIFSVSVGGDLLGGSEGETEKKMSGKVKVKGFTGSPGSTSEEPIDFWKVVEDNLTKIIEMIAQEKERVATVVTEAETREEAKAAATSDKAQVGGKAEAAARQERAGKAEAKGAKTAEKEVTERIKIPQQRGYFTIDRPLGIITVTAPRRTQEQVRSYLNNLQEQLYKQVIIEARIIEVILNDSWQMGIDWSKLANATLKGGITFGSEGGIVYPPGGVISQIKLDVLEFSAAVSALETYGETNILSNPKLNLLNGHGATLTVGKNVTYVSKVETQTTGTVMPIITFTVETATVLSGVGLAIMANIINEDEVILYIVPITSELKDPITTEKLGAEGGSTVQIGLPEINLREMATFARLKNGETLIVGGLIDNYKDQKENKVPFLGDIPILGQAFKWNSEVVRKRELVIILRPQILGKL